MSMIRVDALRLISKLLLCICFISLCYHAVPVYKCSIYISCNTGLGDLVFETITAATIASLSGCKRANIITSYQREHGFYNLTRLQSPHFKFINYETYNRLLRPEFTLPVAARYFGKECGIKGALWVSSFTNRDYDTVIDTMKEVSHSIRIDQCARKSIGIGVHSRRGDQITNRWSSEKALGYNYNKFVNWLVAHNVKTIYLASDDHKWTRAYIKILENKNIKTHYYRRNTALDDLCMLSNAYIIVRLGTTSTFSAVSSIIGKTNLSVIHPNILETNSMREFIHTHEIYSPWVKSGVLNLSVL